MKQLATCRACGNKIESDAKKCVFCGAKNKQKNAKATIGVVFGIISFLFSFSYLVNIKMSKKLNLPFDKEQLLSFSFIIFIISLIGLTFAICSFYFPVRRGKTGFVLNVSSTFMSIVLIILTILY